MSLGHPYIVAKRGEVRYHDRNVLQVANIILVLEFQRVMIYLKI